MNQAGNPSQDLAQDMAQDMAPDTTMNGAVATPHQRAVMRLAASRQRLQRTWLPAESPARAARWAGSTAGTQRLAGVWRLWRRRLSDVPVLGLALDAAQQWWRNNPWRLAGQTVAGELDHALTPWVRRHPLLTVALAAGAGYALVSARAWAWPGVARHWRPMPRRVGGWLLHQITQAPMQSVLAGLLATAAAANASATASASATPDVPNRSPSPSSTSTDTGSP